MTRAELHFCLLSRCWRSATTRSWTAPSHGRQLSSCSKKAKANKTEMAKSVDAVPPSGWCQALLGTSTAAIVGVSNNDWIQVQSGDIRRSPGQV